MPAEIHLVVECCKRYNCGDKDRAVRLYYVRIMTTVVIIIMTIVIMSMRMLEPILSVMFRISDTFARGAVETLQNLKHTFSNLKVRGKCIASNCSIYTATNMTTMMMNRMVLIFDHCRHSDVHVTHYTCNLVECTMPNFYTTVFYCY